MTMHAEMISRPIGPDTIEIPGHPDQLKSAVQGLQGLSRQLEHAAQQLKGANPPDGGRGRAALALSRAAQRTGNVLDADIQQLEDLTQSIDNAADAITRGQASVDDLRRRWRQARETFRDTVQGAKHAPDHPEALMHRIDANLAEAHATQFKRQAGLTFMDPGTGGAKHVDFEQVGGVVDQAITAYRQEVRSVVDEYADVMQKVKNADNQLDEKLPRRSVAIATMTGDGDGSEEQHGMSTPGGVRSVAREIEQAAHVIERATHRLEDVRLSIRAGRMLPDGERVGSNDGFKRDWTEHLDGVRHSLQAACRAGDAVADRLRDVDQNGAADIRQALRDD